MVNVFFFEFYIKSYKKDKVVKIVKGYTYNTNGGINPIRDNALFGYGTNVAV